MKGKLSGVSFHGDLTYMRIEWQKENDAVLYSFIQDICGAAGWMGKWPEEPAEKDSHNFFDGGKVRVDVIFGSSHIHMFIKSSEPEKIKEKIRQYFDFSVLHRAHSAQ